MKAKTIYMLLHCDKREEAYGHWNGKPLKTLFSNKEEAILECRRYNKYGTSTHYKRVEEVTLYL